MKIPQYYCFACFRKANVFYNHYSFCKRCWEWLGWNKTHPVQDGKWEERTIYALYGYLESLKNEKRK